MRLVTAMAVVVGVLFLTSTPAGAQAPAPAPEAVAQAKRQAEQLALDAFALIKDQPAGALPYEKAAKLFVAAYELDRGITHLINAAVALRKGDLPHQAIAIYERVLAEGSGTLSPDFADRVRADLDTIRRTSVQARVLTQGGPVEIELDGRPVGVGTATTPLVVWAPVSGRHTLVARRAGQREARRELVDLAPGAVVDIVLVPTAIPTTGRVLVESVPARAELFIDDGVPHGRAPRSIELVPGGHELVARLPGHVDRLERLTVVAGVDQRLTLRLEPLPPPWYRRRKVLIPVLIVTAAVVGVTGALVYRRANQDSMPDGVIIVLP